MTHLTGEDFRQMALAAAAAIDSQHQVLSRLDAAGGDGDHGSNVRAAMTEARKVISRQPQPSPASVLAALGVSFQEHMGGAAGVLIGEFFAGVADVFGNDQEIDGPTLSEGLSSGLTRLMNLGGATVGDRTMVDALAPAVETAREAARSGATPHELLAVAASSARTGADTTRDLVPTMGRAAYAPEKAVGIPDAGATTLALIFEAWAKSADDRSRS